MENDKYLKITNAVYSLIELFPDDEPLKNKAKEKALTVLDNLISVGFLAGFEKEKTAGQAVGDMETLLGYLGLANLRGFLKKINLIIVSEEYKKIIEEISPIAENYKKSVDPAFVKTTAGEARKWKKISELLPVNDIEEKKEAPMENPAFAKALSGKEKNTNRQNQIIKILKEKGKAQVADLKQIMPDISKRTLRRDLDDLLKKKLIERIGEWNQTFYQVRNI